jgi:trimethylamine--corrinoid protein Co-methyltransferase
MAGAETDSGLGLLESCRLFYPEAMILDADIYQRLRHEAGGLDTSPQALAREVIKDIGPCGNFLKHAHTRTHLRQQAFSSLTGQPAPNGGFPDPVEVARLKAEWILANHYPEALGILPGRQS